MSFIEQNKELRKQVTKYKYDYLTGLKQRYDFTTETQALLDNDIHFAMTLVDVDGLHNTNRQYGIESGDELIKSVANACTKTKDARDVYRIGGDEFVIITPNNPDIGIQNSKYATIHSDGYELVSDMLRDVDKLLTIEKMKTDRRRV